MKKTTALKIEMYISFFACPCLLALADVDWHEGSYFSAIFFFLTGLLSLKNAYMFKKQLAAEEKSQSTE